MNATDPTATGTTATDPAATATGTTATGTAAAAPAADGGPGAPAPDPAPGGGPFAPSTGAVRVFAGTGLVLLVGAFLVTVVLMLRQSYAGDGTPGPLRELAMWSLSLSGLVGLWAMCLPGDAVGHRVRRGAVFVQYALMAGGPLLAAFDPS
ncbi:hypothetical protein ACPB9J_26645 [Streptomyces lavendulocolor]|uniref:hypothetical protein n=1 Tax=Streptomyces lavendulocolor TaxID=67316 RepID=UPI003C2C1AA3